MSGHGIETRALDTIFRSRLEARWAHFFDLIGWRWTYEPFDADYYIPDFLIHGNAPLLVEVKPYVTLAELQEEVDRVMPKLEGHWNHDVLFVGSDPFIDFEPVYTGGGSYGCSRSEDYLARSAGLLSCASYRHEDDGTYSSDVAIWTDIGGFGVREELMSFKSRPTGDYDGNCEGLTTLGSRHLETSWRKAGGPARWSAKKK